MWFLPNSKPSDTAVLTEDKPAAMPDKLQPLAESSKPKPVEAPVRQVYDESQLFFVVLIVFAAITLRLLFFFLGPFSDSERAMYPDSYRYVELGETLIGEGVFGLSSPETGVVHEPLHELRSELGQVEQVDEAGHRPEIMRTPGYPALLGSTAWLGLGINGLLLIQCLFSAISVALVYGIGRALIKRPGPALFAAVVVAVHPADVIAPTSVLTETCFTLLVLLGLWAVADKEKRGIGTTSFGGLMIGLSVLVRPVSVFLGPAVALWMIVTDRRLKTVVLAGLMVALSLAPAAAWMARNNAVGFGYRLSSIPYINSYFYGDAYMRITDQRGDWQRDWPDTVNTLMGELQAEQNLHPDQNVFDTMQSLAFEAIRQDPELYGMVLLNSMSKFFTDHSLGGLYQQLGLTYTPTGLRERLLTGGFSWENLSQSLKNPTGWIALTWSSFNALLTFGMVLGGVMLLVRRHWAAFFLLSGVMFYFAFATQTTGLERFRLPVLGIQALLVASIFCPRIPRPKQAKTPKRRWYDSDDDGSHHERPDKKVTSTTFGLANIPEPESKASTRPI